MKIFDKLKKEFGLNLAFNIIIVILNIKPAFLGNVTEDKIKKIKKIIGDQVNVVTFDENKLMLIYSNTISKKVDEFIEKHKKSGNRDHELLGEILGYSCPWKKNRKPKKIEYAYDIRLYNDDQFMQPIAFVCDDQNHKHKSVIINIAKKMKRVLKSLNMEEWSITTNISEVIRIN